jgi:hypothetical protein
VTHQSDARSRGGLQDTTDREDGASGDDGDSSTKVVGNVTGHQRTEKGTGRENRGEEGLGRRGNGGFVGVELDEVRHGADVRRFPPGSRDKTNDYSQDTSHPSSVVTEEDTSERGKDTKKVGSSSDGGFDPVGVGGTRQHDTSSGH